MDDSSHILYSTPINFGDASLFDSLITSISSQTNPYISKFVEYLDGAGSTSKTIFENILSLIQKKSCINVLIESHYVEKNYLEDYSYFFSKCFSQYDKFCYRLHFFSDIPSDESLLENLKTHSKGIESKYLGYVVIKPLPETIVGVTCLDIDKLNVSTCKSTHSTHNINLLGIRFPINALPFQEQNGITAACATSAIWVSLNATGKSFHHSIPSLVEITKNATDGQPHKLRNFPNNGLTVDQTLHAIKKTGIEYIATEARVQKDLLGKIKAYTDLGIPTVLFGITISKSLLENFYQSQLKEIEQKALARINRDNEGKKIKQLSDIDKSKIVLLRNSNFEDSIDDLIDIISSSNKPSVKNLVKNRHAVTCVGYETSTEFSNPVEVFRILDRKKIRSKSKEAGFFTQVESFDFYKKSSRIKSLYIHDDQKGPYIKYRKIKSKMHSIYSMEDSIFLTQFLVIPVYNKIRIPFDRVYDKVKRFGAAVFVALEASGISDTSIEWEISLMDVSSYKSNYLRKLDINKDALFKLLSQPLPKYIWNAVATMRHSTAKTPVLSLAFDATDSHHNDFCVQVLKDLSDIPKVLDNFYFENSTLSNTLINKEYLVGKDIQRIVKMFLTQK